MAGSWTDQLRADLPVSRSSQKQGANRKEHFEKPVHLGTPKSIRGAHPNRYFGDAGSALFSPHCRPESIFCISYQ